MPCEGHYPCCHCHCEECVCCDPYTSKTDCGICEDCIHTIRIARPKEGFDKVRACRKHEFVTYAYMDEPSRRICGKCSYPEPTPLDVAAMGLG